MFKKKYDYKDLAKKKAIGIDQKTFESAQDLEYMEEQLTPEVKKESGAIMTGNFYSDPGRHDVRK